VRRLAFCLVVVCVMSSAGTASAAVRWTQNGERLGRGQQILFAGASGGVRFDFASTPITCTSTFSTGALVTRGVKQLRRTYSGCRIDALDEANEIVSTGTCQTIQTKNLKGKLILLENGHVGVRLKKPSFARFTCILRGAATEYKIGGTLVEDLGVALGVTVSGLSASLACQDLVLVERTRPGPKIVRPVLMTALTPVEEPTISPEQFAATGGGESVAVECPQVIGD
jgi:hypothetical protein